MNYNIDSDYHLGQTVFVIVERTNTKKVKCEICAAVEFDDDEECPRCFDDGSYQKSAGKYWDYRGEAVVTTITLTHNEDGKLQIDYKIIGDGFWHYETKRVFAVAQEAKDAVAELNIGREVPK